MKPGIHTTEFWLTLAVNLAALISATSEALPPKWAAIMASVATGLYALARGWAKSNVPLPPGTRQPGQ